MNNLITVLRDGRIQWPKLAASLALAYAAAAIGGLATSAAIPTWYATLDKPFFTPPNWLFGPVWTVLYAMMGLALYLVWTNRASLKWPAYVWFGVQLVLNTLWSLVFFGLRLPWGGVVVIVLLLAAIILTIREFAPFNRVAAWLLLPYLSWVSFATCLTVGVALLN